jgi:hypothetical protein
MSSETDGFPNESFKKQVQTQNHPANQTQLPNQPTSNLSNSVSSNGATSSTASNVLAAIRKEKQRPETWNKIEQQIFFNALRQVCMRAYIF